jgi:lauroyl/myristoyl acyltransferase
VQSFAAAGGSVSWLAGGAFTLPLAARLIRRSQAALSSCSAAVFFAPGQGSLAVAAHAVAAGIPVFAFTQAMPAPIPHTAGAWVAGSFSGFSCWSFQVAQINLF